MIRRFVFGSVLRVRIGWEIKLPRISAQCIFEALSGSMWKGIRRRINTGLLGQANQLLEREV
jgi:hypothetical protein